MKPRTASWYSGLVAHAIAAGYFANFHAARRPSIRAVAFGGVVSDEFVDDQLGGVAKFALGCAGGGGFRLGFGGDGRWGSPNRIGRDRFGIAWSGQRNGILRRGSLGRFDWKFGLLRDWVREFFDRGEVFCKKGGQLG